MDDVGFIHCSTAEQVAGVADFIYGDYEGDLLLLDISLDSLRLDGVEVRFEDGGNGQLFPHIYGPLEVRHVVQVSPFRRG